MIVQALEVLSVLMQEDDENVEVWYLMAVAFNNLQPPDRESARSAFYHPLFRSGACNICGAICFARLKSEPCPRWPDLREDSP